MVNFWPFKGSDDSAASFEKSLSHLSSKINKANGQNDSFRQKQRRYKVLWTLYTAFAYILVAAILTLVTGYQSWGAPEYTAIVGSPVLIYLVRTALDAYYNYRLSNNQTNLNDLNKQRDRVIQKLKTVTRYDSTQQLLDKYGGSPRQRQPSPRPTKTRNSEGDQSKQGTPQGSRTGVAPPPTANIQRAPTAGSSTPQSTPGQPQRSPTGPPPNATGLMPPQNEPNEDFAPNAFSAAPRPSLTLREPSQQYSEGARWYDRILDVVLGEDETQAKNRAALICDNCRLVNGQAPPGARTPEDIGRWRCSSCHAWNGVESEEKRILKHISGEPMSPMSPTSAVSESAPRSVESEDGDFNDDDEDEEMGGEEEHDGTQTESMSPAASTRSKARQRKKA